MSVKPSESLNSPWIFAFGLILSLASLKVFHVVYQEQNTVYMDEIFHVPQAKLYCDHRWTEWNPKITTLPGLYLISYIFLKPFQNLGNENFCSLYALRFTNLIATVLNFYITFRIICSLEEKHKIKSKIHFKLFTAFNLAIFPPLYFFTFLYYTDVWSVTFVLLIYKFHLENGNKLLAFSASFMAVLMRQTNVIWVGLMIIDDSWNVLCRNVKSPPVQDYKYTIRVLRKIVPEYLNFTNPRHLFRLMREVIQTTYHNLIICLLFVCFVIINKSIVLGDKEAHTATFHPMQGLYFLDFFAFFTWPFLILENISRRFADLTAAGIIRRTVLQPNDVILNLILIPIHSFFSDTGLYLLSTLPTLSLLFHSVVLLMMSSRRRQRVASLWRKPHNIFLIVFLIGLCAGLSEINKLEHPYLLADNRHLAFYLWKRVFGHPIIRRLVVPSYICSGILILRSLEKRNHFMFMVALLFCTFLNLTPQYLFEFRYFIIPFTLFRLQFKQSRVVYMETVFFIAINMGVLYLFLSKPFVWPSEPDAKQRFIW